MPGRICPLIHNRSCTPITRPIVELNVLKTNIMKYILPSIAALTLSILPLHGAEFDKLARQFIAATSEDDSGQLDKVFAESPTKKKTISESAQVQAVITSGKLKITAIDKKLEIGDLGVTLMRHDFEREPKGSFRPIVCVRTAGQWKVYPWSSTSDMWVLAETRTPDERIHIQLFNKWANLMEDLLIEQAEQPATQPKVAPPVKDQPSIPTSKDGPR